MRHGYEWAYALAFGSKWRQVYGVPQGIPYGVGVAQLLPQKKEHQEYEADPTLKLKFHRARNIDDFIM